MTIFIGKNIIGDNIPAGTSLVDEVSLVVESVIDFEIVHYYLSCSYKQW